MTLCVSPFSISRTRLFTKVSYFLSGQKQANGSQAGQDVHCDSLDSDQSGDTGTQRAYQREAQTRRACPVPLILPHTTRFNG